MGAAIDGTATLTININRVPSVTCVHLDTVQGHGGNRFFVGGLFIIFVTALFSVGCLDMEGCTKVKVGQCVVEGL